jgi:hypothetical protein
MKQSFFKQRKVKLTGYLLVFLTGIVLLLLPADFFDHGQPMCISVLLFDRECYGCGMTRAIQHLIHFDISAAMHFNKLSLVVFPLLTFLLIKDFIDLLKAKKENTKN